MFGSILTSIPAAFSWAAILSRSRTRKFSIQNLLSSPKYLLFSGNGEKAVVPASFSISVPPEIPSVRYLRSVCHFPLSGHHCGRGAGLDSAFAAQDARGNQR